jgi:branched-chain amino acid transport system substrate-binding protein
MNMQKRTYCKMIVAMGVVALILTTFLVSPSVSQTVPIKIGTFTPLSGHAAYYGEHIVIGAKLAIDEVNEKGGLLGRKIEFIAEDDKNVPAEAVTAAEKLITKDQVVALSASMGSSPVLAVMPKVNEAKVPMFVQTATSVLITQQSGKGGNPWTFKCNPNDAMMLTALAKFIVEKRGVKSVCFIGEDTDFGRGIVKGLKEWMEANGVKILSEDYVKGGETEFTPLLTKVKGLKPDVLGLGVVGPTQIQALVKQMLELGMKIPLTGRYDITAKQIADYIASGAMEGSTCVEPYSHLYEGGRNPQFVQMVKTKLGRDTGIYWWGVYWSYEATRVMLEAIKQGGKAERQAIRDAAAKVEMELITGVKVKFDDNNQWHPPAFITGVKDGKIVLFGDVLT